MDIPFGISFKLKGGKHEDYKYREVAHFIEVADSIYPESLREDYIKFLGDFMGGKIKKSTSVDIELVKLLQGDFDNRAQIDYREGHWDDDEEIFSGGEYFDQVANKLKIHIQNHEITTCTFR